MNRQQQIDEFLLAAHRSALSRLRAEPARIEPVRAQLARWRVQSDPTRSDPYRDEWQQLLAADLEPSERAALLREARSA